MECRVTCSRVVAGRGLTARRCWSVVTDHVACHTGPEHADGSPFNEEDWTDPSYKTVGPYVKSKVAICRFAATADAHLV